MVNVLEIILNGKKYGLIHDNYQNFKSYQIPKAQLIIADVPYNLGSNAYASNPMWYKDGDISNGESEKAGKSFFHTDNNFKPAEFMHFCSQMLKKEPKETGKAPVLLLFCSFEQQMYFIELGKRYGLKNYINLVFRKDYSAQVLKANMRIVTNCEYGLLLYRDKLPKFKNNGKMIYNCIDYPRLGESMNEVKIHPTQKPIKLLEFFIELFSEEDDVIIDPVAGSGSTIIAAMNKNREAYGFEVDKSFYNQAKNWIENHSTILNDIKKYGFAKTYINKQYPTLF